MDLYVPADVRLDFRSGLPIADESTEFIYSEHLVEHLPLEAGVSLFSECRRVLAPGGIMRLATPDLSSVVEDYPKRWRDHDWVNWPEYAWVDSAARMVNTAMRHWGHLYLYDFDELKLRLEKAGFEHVERCSIGESSHEELRGLETRADSLLIVEAAWSGGSAT